MKSSLHDRLLKLEQRIFLENFNSKGIFSWFIKKYNLWRIKKKFSFDDYGAIGVNDEETKKTFEDIYMEGEAFFKESAKEDIEEFFNKIKERRSGINQRSYYGEQLSEKLRHSVVVETKY
jgi:hypothetical protein